jgi:alpha-1,2-mannosyltransferase
MDDRLRRVMGRPYQLVAWGIAAIAVLTGFVSVCIRPRGDFTLHWVLGKNVVTGAFLYPGGGMDSPYPPFWALAHAPFALINVYGPSWFTEVPAGLMRTVHVAEILIYPFGIVGMCWLVVILKRLGDRHWPMGEELVFWSGALAILLASPFLDRDLAELGVNTFLVMLAWWGIWLWIRGRDWAACVLIGLATALKCTPAAFIAYFFWKRQWKVACGSAVVAVALSLSPVLVMGTHAYVAAEKFWLHGVWAGVSDPDPSHTVLGYDRMGNLSLRPALARYLVYLPYGNPGRPETPVDTLIPTEPPEPLYFQFLKLPPPVAGKIVRGILLAIALVTAWIFRRRVTNRDDPRILWECAAVSVAMLLYSPLTWAQHCPGVLPAFYFIFRAGLAGERLPGFVRWVVVVFFVLMVVLARGVIGQRWMGLMDAYHLRNFCLLGLFVSALACHNLGRRAAVR